MFELKSIGYLLVAYTNEEESIFYLFCGCVSK